MKKLKITSLFALLLLAFMPLTMDAQAVNNVKEIVNTMDSTSVDFSKYLDQVEAESLKRANAQLEGTTGPEGLTININQDNLELTPSTPVTVTGTVENIGVKDVENIKFLSYNTFNTSKNADFYDMNVTDGLVTELAGGESDEFAVEVSLTDSSIFSINKEAMQAIIDETATPKDIIGLVSALTNDIFDVRINYDIVNGVTNKMAEDLAKDVVSIDATENTSFSKTGDLEVSYTTEGHVEVTYTNDGLNSLLFFVTSYGSQVTQNSTISFKVNGSEYTIVDNETVEFDGNVLDFIVNPGESITFNLDITGETLDNYNVDQLEGVIEVDIYDVFFDQNTNDKSDIIFSPSITDGNTGTTDGDNTNTTDGDDTTTDSSNGNSTSSDEETLTSTGAGVVMTAAASGTSIAGALVLLRRKF